MAADVKDLLLKLTMDITGYKTSISEAKSDLKTLQTQMKNADSDLNVDAAGRTLEENLKLQMESLQKQAELYDQAITAAEEKLTAATGTNKESWAKKELNDLESKSADVQGKLQKLQEQLDNLKTEKFLSTVSTVVDGFQQISAGYNRLFGWAGEAADAGYEEFVSREDAFAGVVKALGQYSPTQQQLNDLDAGLSEMATRIPKTYEELAAIMAMAAQAGGVPLQNLLAFTETFAALSVSTDLIGEGGVKTFAQFLNISDGVSDKAKEAASALVALGNTQAATENDIIQMALRMASATSLAGFGTEDILAYSAAFTALGIRAEAGGSAFSKLVTDMAKAVESGGDDLMIFARSAGQTAEEFAAAWNADPAAAMAAFFANLNKLGESGEESLFSMLAGMGITEVRQSNLARAAASGWELLAEALSIAREGYAENIALDKEAAERYGTTASQNQMNANKWANAEEEMGEAVARIRMPWDTFFADVAQQFTDMPQWVQDAAGYVSEAAGLIGDGLGTVGNIGMGVYGITKGVQTLKGVNWGTVGKAAGTVGSIALGGAAAVGIYELMNYFYQMSTDVSSIVENLNNIQITVDEDSKNATLAAIAEVQAASDRLNGYTPEEEEKYARTSQVTQMGFGSAEMFGTSVGYEMTKARQELDAIALEYGSMIAGIDEQILAAEDDATRKALRTQREQTEQQLQTAIDDAKERYTATMANLFAGMYWQGNPETDNAVNDIMWALDSYKALYAEYERETDVIRRHTLQGQMAAELESVNTALETVLGDESIATLISSLLTSGALENMDFSALTGTVLGGVLEAINLATAVRQGGDTEAIGQNLVRGIGSGISDNTSLAGAGVTKLKDDVVTMLNTAFGIQSPSKVMAERAQYIPLGVAQGITDHTAEAVASITALGDAMIAEAEKQAALIAAAMTVLVPAPQYTGGGVNGSGVGTAAAGGNTAVTSNLYVQNMYNDNGANAQSLINTIAGRLTRNQRAFGSRG